MKKKIALILAAVSFVLCASCLFGCDDTTRLTCKLSFELTEDGQSYSLVRVEWSPLIQHLKLYQNVSIPSKHNGKPVTRIRSEAFRDYRGDNIIRSVKIPKSITSIDSGAFDYNCKFIKIEDGVSYVDKWMIRCDESMSSVKLRSDTVGIASFAFFNCEYMENITIPKNVRNISTHAFALSGIANIAVDGKNKKYHSNGNCIIETASKTLIAGCNNSVIPNDGSVTSIGDGAFSGCSSLTSVEIPNSVTNIGRSAFADCSGLTSIEIPNGVTNIGDCAFGYCSGLTGITVGDDNAYYRGVDNCIIEIASKTLIAGCNNSVIPNDGSVTSIGDGAFSGCSSLTSVEIPNSVTSIGAYAFSGCVGLTNIEIPNGVTNIEEIAFWGCSSLTSVELPNSVTSIGERAFWGCSSLTSVVIPNGIMNIETSAFDGCESLAKVFYNGDIASWCGISGLYSIMQHDIILYIGGKELSGELIIPNGLASIGDSAFENYRRITSVKIPNSLMSIGHRAFVNCSNLFSIFYDGTKAQWDAIKKDVGWSHGLPFHCTSYFTDLTITGLPQ